MNAPASNYERFLQRVARAGRIRQHENFELRRQLKDALVAECSEISQTDYIAAVAAIDKATGFATEAQR